VMTAFNKTHRRICVHSRSVKTETTTTEAK
jgi:hypothetical protein